MRGVLALDQGGHASRACVFDQNGMLVAERQVPIRTLQHESGAVEHHADELAASLLTAARQVLQATPDIDIEHAGLATQRSTIVCFERETGAVLSPAISWQDRRNAAWLAGFSPQAARIRALTGLPLSPHYGVGKIRWCLDHLPPVQQARARGALLAAPLAAFLVARLGGGAACVDPANASRTLLWDMTQRDWSTELMALFGVERAILPACAWTRASFGALRVAGRDIALSAVSGDQSAIAFAFGEPDARTAYVNLGTGAFIQRPLMARPERSAALLSSILAADAHSACYSLEGTVNGAGSATGWFAQQCGRNEARLWQALESVGSAAPLPLFINGIGGLGSPYWRPQLHSHFIGAGDEIAQFAAVVESIAFLIADNFALLNTAEAQLHRVVLTGGLSRSDWLCRRLAALLALPVTRMKHEATVRGMAALAAPRLAQQWPAPSGELFEPIAIGAAAQRYRNFRAALAAALIE